MRGRAWTGEVCTGLDRRGKLWRRHGLARQAWRGAACNGQVRRGEAGRCLAGAERLVRKGDACWSMEWQGGDLYCTARQARLGL